MKYTRVFQSAGSREPDYMSVDVSCSTGLFQSAGSREPDFQDSLMNGTNIWFQSAGSREPDLLTSLNAQRIAGVSIRRLARA